MSFFDSLKKQLNKTRTSFQGLSKWKQIGLGVAIIGVSYKLYKYSQTSPKTEKEEEKEIKEWYPDVPHFEAKKVVDCKNLLGECCLWDDRKKLLCWIDNVGKKFCIYDPIKAEFKSYDTPECPGSFCFCENGSYLFAFETGPAFYDINTQKQSKKIFNFEPNIRSKMNDGRCDRNGRFIVGGMTQFYIGASNQSTLMKYFNFIRNFYMFKYASHPSIYRINKDLSYQVLVEDIICANSICFSLNGNKMYYTDSIGWGHDPKIMQLDYYNDKTLPSNKKIFTKQCKAPDGSVIDSKGNIWNAHCGIGKVSCIDKKGNVIMVIDVPEKYPTCCVLGGNNLDTLYITTLNPAIFGLPATNDQGGLYEVKLLNVKGVRENRFGGTDDQMK